MSVAYTSSELLASIKRRAMIPASQVTFSDAELLLIATEELHSWILPRILSDREYYYLSEAGATQSVTSNQPAYDIPYRAVGKMLQDVILVDSADNQRSLALISPEMVADYNITEPATPHAFYYRNNKIILSPTPNSNEYSLKTPYYIRPSQIIETSAAARITNIDTDTNTITVSGLPSTITVNTPVDFIKHKPGFESLEIDVSISSISGSDLTFSSLPTGLEANDYIALAEQSPIPQLPAELHPLLAQRVAVFVLSSLGDANGLRIALNVLKAMEEQSFKLTNPRTHGEMAKVVTPSWWR